MAEEDKESKGNKDNTKDSGQDLEVENQEGNEDSKKLGSKKKIIIIAVIVLVALGAIFAGLYFSGIIFSPEEVSADVEVEGDGNGEKVNTKVVYYDLDEFIVNLDVGTKLPTFLKLKVVLELDGADQIPIIEENKPRIIDSFQIYLRTLRRSDLQGAKILEPLRMELLSRISRIAYPVKINRILFKEFLVQ